VSKLDTDLATLREMSPAQLRNRWEEMGEGAAPRMPPSILGPLLAQRLQERRLGGLPALVLRELKRVAEEGAASAPQPVRTQLVPGTRLVREWNGRTISVGVLEKGFAFDNRSWRSLSEIARHVTGAHWSGPRFFGLTANG
jgi:hypothetical protein